MSEIFSEHSDTIKEEGKEASIPLDKPVALPATTDLPTPPNNTASLDEVATAITKLSTEPVGATTFIDPQATIVQAPDLCAWRENIRQDLMRLDSQLKRTSVLAYIDTKLAGKGYDTPEFWSRPDTCARSTWNKWKKYDPVFTQVLTSAYEKAQLACNDAALDAIGQAQRILQLNSPQAAMNLVGYATGANFAKPEAEIRAAIAVLDRAGSATADKTPANVGTTADVQIYIPDNGRSVDDEE